MISVCMATYNGGKYIDAQLISIISQLSADDEIVISDDGSKDDTLAIIRQVQSKTNVPINIYLNEGEHGYTPNFENALSHAQGDFIFLADQDDVWFPSKVSTQCQVLSRGSVVLCIANAKITDEQLRVTHNDYYAIRGVHRGFVGNLYKFGYLGCSMAFTRQVLDKALPFPRNHHYCTHDNWLYLCASIVGNVEVLAEPLFYYRRHEGVSTTGAFNAHKPFSFRIRYRLYLVGQLMLRMFKK